MVSRTDDEMDVDEELVKGISEARNKSQKKTPRARKTKRMRTMHSTSKKRTRRGRLKELSSAYFSTTHRSA
jgi:hypothetical protein